MGNIQNLSEPWDGLHTGDEIEAFLKHELSKIKQRYGEAVVTTDENGLVTIRFFENSESASLWQEDPVLHADLMLKSISFQGGGEAQEYTMIARVVSPLDTVQVAGEVNVFEFFYNSYWGSDTSDLDSQPGLAIVTVNGIEVERIFTQSGGNQYSINVGQYITQEINNVKIIVSNSHGKSRTWDYNVEAKSLSVAFPESYLNQQHIAKSAGWSLPVQVNGVGGMVHVSVDNGTLQYEHQVAGGTQYSFPIDSNGLLARGTHTIEVWCVDSVYGLLSNHITTSYIVASDSLGIAIGANAPSQVMMYDTVLIPYYLYSPANEEGDEVAVTIQVKDDNQLVITQSQQTVTLDGNKSSGLQYATVQIMDNSYTGTTVTLSVSAGSGAGTVTATQALDVVAAGVVLREAAECKVHYNMAGKTNSDTDVAANSMESYYNGTRTSRLLRSANFALNNSNGFQNGGFIVPAQKTLTLKDWQPFAQDFGVNGNHEGKTIEMEFSVGVAADMDIPVISCMDNKCGFEVYPTRIEVKYASSNSRVITYFPDEERIKFSLVINGTATNCVNDDGNGNREEQLRNLAFLYVNGVMVRIFDYGVSTWNQTNVNDITFGSAECNLTVYSIRGYDKALTMREVLDNYSYDTPLLADKIAIATRNNILQSDGVTVSRQLVEAALPNTPIINWWMERLPANKKDPRECEQTDFTNPEWSGNGHACAPFTAGSHEINGDGTSSNAYPLPYKNWAEKYKDWNGGSQGIITLHLTGGDETVKKYSITYGIDDKETKFVHKVNFASSEGIFNILAMNMYQQITLSAYRGINDLLSLQQQGQVDNGADITFRKSLSGFPEIGFRTYTENGQLVTKFLSIYNFINNKKTGSMFGMVEDYKVNQLWEVDENVNFFNTKMTEHTVDGDTIIESNGVRNISPMYYSRFPADSPVNDGCDLGLPENVTQVAQANDEIRALRKVHNWIVSINPNVAARYYARYGEYRPFTMEEDGYTSRVISGVTYTRDTPQFRSMKFIEECDDYLHVNDCIFYFVFCTYILGMDSMDKNMSLFFDTVEDFYSDDAEVRENAKVKLRIMLRDTDTIGLFNNSGVLTYKYWHEWNDTYNPETGETGQITGESYDAETGQYTIQTNVPGSSPVFNGRMSGLWDAINTYVPAQIRTVYLAMRQAGLNSNTFMEMYERFHNYWCEALYNVDGLGYANTGNFTMAYGDKLQNSKYFFKYRERYMDSKYGYAVDAKQVTLRLSSVPVGIWMKHCTPIYASFSYGGSTATTARSIEVGEAALLPCTAVTFNDATCYINDADLVTEIGTYTMPASGIPVLNGWEGMQNFHFTFNFGRLVRLQKFIWANTEVRPNTEQTVANGSIEFQNLKMLKELVMTYCTNWRGTPIIGSEIIEKIDFRGTPIETITIPETNTLTELQLPATLTELRVKNCPNISTFSIAGVNNLEVIEVENTPIDVFSLVQRIYNAYKNGDTVALRSARITGINTTIEDSDGSDMLMWIAGLEDATIEGTITLGESVVLTFDQKMQLMDAFGNIDSNSNPLKVNYTYQHSTVTSSIEIFCDGVADVVKEAGQYQFKVIPFEADNINPNAAFLSNIRWELEENPYATIDEHGLLTVTGVGTVEGAPSADLTVRADLLDGDMVKGYEVTKIITLYFYDKEAELGDYVYCDASYSKVWYKVKTCVGIVVLNEDGITELCALTHIGKDVWGLCNSNGSTMSGVTIDGTTKAYDTPIPNVSGTGVSSVKDTNSDYFDVENDVFKPITSFPADSVFLPSETVVVDNLVGGDVEFRKDAIYSSGYYKTILLMNWRNRALSYASLEIPAPSAEHDELYNLSQLINKVVSENSNDYRQYYYPAASMCYAYSPAIKSYESLHDKFKAHKWYLPDGKALARTSFYYSRNDTTGSSKYDAFKDAKANNRISLISVNNYTGGYSSISECQNVSIPGGYINMIDMAGGVYYGYNYYYTGAKNVQDYILPFCTL